MTKIQHKNSSALPVTLVLLSLAELVVVLGLASSHPTQQTSPSSWLTLLAYISMPALAGGLFRYNHEKYKYLAYLLLLAHVGILVLSQI